MKGTDSKESPIRYKGKEFRSMLEVQWAAFFDRLGLQYEYQLQEFRPDFHFPLWHAHAVIRQTYHIEPPDLRRMYSFALTGRKHLLLIIGTPKKHRMFLIDRCHACNLETYFEKVTQESVLLALADLERTASVTIARRPLRYHEYAITYAKASQQHDSLMADAIEKAEQAVSSPSAPEATNQPLHP